MDEQEPPVMTVDELAAYLPKVPRGSVYKLAQRGKIPGQKVGRHWRFRREAVDTWLDSAQSPSDADAKRIPGS